ncbi:acidic mammalian chitinase [Drosophila subobscura]|uniref:acidic mammalian chitinase n=1 Tax=Drosophila subobscura TaxID=7241 RepID=UPI00155AC29A|nr:acidic mammalian chitinase [Drosophila subobscura]
MKLYTFWALSVLCLCLCLGLGQVASSSEKLVNCYWGTWANYRPGDGKFTPSDIDPFLCTHISYTFFGIGDGGEFKSLDTWLDMDDGLGFISQTIALKQRNPNLKILAVVGGWNEGSIKYSALAADAGKRATFISTTLAFIQQHGFDGLDLDWEYPGQRGGSEADRVNFVTLLREIKETFDRYGLELGIAVGASEKSATISYDIPAISQHLTFINVMTYDFHMALDGYLGLNAPLPEVTESIDYWLAQGAPAEKLILGIGFYGHSYQMSDASQNWPGAACIGPGTAGVYTRENGFMGYHEICLNNWQTVFDQETGAPYAFQGDQWIGYDNPESIQLKMKLVESRNLGGVMMWSIETDDFRGLCGESYPLLKTINRALGNEVSGGGAGGGIVTPAPTPGPTQGGGGGGGGSPAGDCSNDGYFLHSSDCAKYYQCVGGLRYDFECPSGLYFDVITTTCTWPSQTSCPY